jgi:hypothetical protein
MNLPLGSRVGRLAVMEHLLTMSLVAPRGISLRLFGALGREIRDMRIEMESELQLEGLLIARLTAVARQPPPAGDRRVLDDRIRLTEYPPFDDGDHLVEDQVTPTIYKRLT